jgi:hypothetical protein
VKLPCMAEPKLRRRGHGEDAIYFAASKNRYVGAVSLGFTPEGKRIRRKVSGKTKQEVRDTLRALHEELDAGVRSPSGCTVRRAVEDWLGEGLHGRSEKTTTLYASTVGTPLSANNVIRSFRTITERRDLGGTGYPAR